MKIHHWVGSILWVMVGIYVAVHAYYLGLGHLRQPGPGFIFFLSALLLIILGVLDLTVSFIRRFKTDEEEPIWLGLRWQNVLMVLVALSIYVYILSDLGFLLSTFLLMVFLFKAIEPTRWWIAIVSSVITMLISHVLFQILLKVSFPRGFFGF